LRSRGSGEAPVIIVIIGAANYNVRKIWEAINFCTQEQPGAA